jgi:hypothetical protein
MKLIVKAAAAVSLMAMSFGAMAAPADGFNPDNLFFGAGISINDAPGLDEGTGYQFFGGYEFGQVAKNVNLDLEVGFWDSGDLCDGIGIIDCEADGLWANAVGRFAVAQDVELIGRAGLDFGDDDGLMLGVGAGLILNKQSTLRLELVERDDISSIQLNYVYRP